MEEIKGKIRSLERSIEKEENKIEFLRASFEALETTSVPFEEPEIKGARGILEGVIIGLCEAREELRGLCGPEEDQEATAETTQ
jgi:hypothetical protein